MNSEEKSIVEQELGLLDHEYRMLREVAEETIKNLGEDSIAYWVDAYNTCIDIESALLKGIDKETLEKSLLHLRFGELFKELSWLRFLFLVGNYPMLARELRFTWEAICQAYHMDAQFSELDLDAKTAKLSKKKYRGLPIINKVLPDILPLWTDQLKRQYRSLWNQLSEMVHPTRLEIDLKVLEGSGALLMTDTLVESIALETLDIARRVLDVVWCAAFAEYPQLSEGFRKEPYLVEHLQSYCPQASRWLERLKDRSALKDKG